MRFAKFLYDRIGWIEHYPLFGWTGVIWNRVYQRYYND